MANFTELIEQLFESFTVVIGGLSGGLKEAFGQLIYVDPSASSPVFSPLVVFLFIGGSVVLGMGILYKVFGMIRGVAHK